MSELEQRALRIWQDVAYDFSVRDRLPSTGLVKADSDEFKVEFARRLLAEQQKQEPCPACKGTGKVLVNSFVDSSKQIENSCRVCRGRGTLGAPPQDAQDALRYRWLQEHANLSLGGLIGGPQLELDRWALQQTKEVELDAAIDAALKEPTK